MLLPYNKRKCRLSEGCFFAIASLAGYVVEKVSEEDDYGVDFRLKKIVERNGHQRDGSVIVEFQLKSSSNWTDKETSIEYSLKNKAYNDIIQRNIEGWTPLILILMCLPSNIGDFADIDCNSVVFKRSLFWFHTGDSALKENEESSTVITIPKSNVLTCDSFADIINYVESLY